MTDKVQKIREEIKRLMHNHDSALDYEAALEDVRNFIDSLQEEPVSEELEKASKEWLRPQLDKSYANYGEGKMMELTHFDGYAMLDAIEFGAKWQKEQLMKDTIDTTIKQGCTDLGILIKGLDEDKFSFGDKVKVIIIKEG